ncbi:MAG: hypothetical protein FD131_4456 [Rhodocyclaceae bacterium]|nr:MAG: hypothetical protein FD131_4456 [Rhodocyclaceae bacterium]
MTSIASVPSTTGISASTGTGSGNSAQIAALEKQLQALQKQLKTAQKDTSGDNAEKIKLLQAQIAQIQAQIAQLRAQEKQAANQPSSTTAAGPAAKAESGTLGVNVDEFV